MRSLRIIFFTVLVMSLVAQVPEKKIYLDNGDVIHGKVKESDDGESYRIKSDIYGVITIPKTRVKKVSDIDTNAALSRERELTESGMAAGGPDENKISINDFAVNSQNPDHRNLGKGFSELIAYEVKKSPRVRLVEREKRTALFKEMELSMTGAVDEKDQVKVGKMLACNYIVFGEIVDMAGTLLLSLRMTKVESGEVVWRKQITEPGKNYPYISAFFAKDILTSLKLDVDRSITDNLALKKVMNEDAVVKLSKGIDAYDRKDISTAKAELDAARQLDPDNKVVQVFLNKLSGATSKFKVVPERYVSMVNPSYLGAAKQDRIYISASMMNLAGMMASRNIDKATWVVTPTGFNQNGYGSMEQGQELILGYVVPITKGWGIGAEFNMYNNMDMVSSGVKSDEPGNLWTTANYDANYLRGMITTGFSIGDWLGVGAGFAVVYRELGMTGWGWNATNHTYMHKGDTIGKTGWLTNYDYDLNTVFGGELGILIKDPTDTILFDTLIAYNMDSAYTVTPQTNFISYSVPLFIENTLTFALNEKRTFIVLKQMNEIYLGRGLYVGKAMPAVEHWLWDWLSVRAGVEGTMIQFPGSSAQWGIGALAGVTPRIKFGDAILDIDVNYTYRPRPSRTIDGLVINEQLVFATISLSGLAVNRN